MLKVAWKKLSENATIPKKAHLEDAGYDLYSAEEVAIHPGETKLVKTNIAVQMTPEEGWSCFGEIKDCSGNALKKKLSTKGGVVDSGYEGDVGVIIKNNADRIINIVKGDKIAQIIFQSIPLIEEVPWVEKETERGENGYGSTGMVKG